MEGSIYDRPAIEQEYFGLFFSQYAKEIMSLPVVPGMAKVLEELAGRYTLIIVSSTIFAPIQAYTDCHNLSQYFKEILGGDHEKSKTKKFQMIFKKYGIGAKDCVFITDTLGDLAEAKAARVGALAVTWGFHPPETLAKGRPTGFIHKPQEMTGKIKEYFKNS